MDELFTQEDVDAFRESVVHPSWANRALLALPTMGTGDSLAYAVADVIPGSAVAVVSCPETPIPIRGWWRRVWAAIRDKPTWEISERLGSVRVLVITAKEVDPDTARLAALALERVRPSGLVVDIEYHIGIGSGGVAVEGV